MDIARLGSHPTPVGPEIENTAVTPPSPGTPRETSDIAAGEHSAAPAPSPANVSKPPLDEPTLKTVLSERLTKAWSGPGDEGPEESSSAHFSKGPLGDPALKALVSEKQGGGSGYSGPQIRMDRNIIHDDDDDGGGGGGPDAPSGDGWGVSKSEDPKSLNSNDGNVPKSGDDDNNGPTRGVGFSFTGRPGREGDGHATATSGGTSTSSGSTSSSSSTSGSSSSSGSTSTGSTSTVHPQHK